MTIEAEAARCAAKPIVHRFVQAGGSMCAISHSLGTLARRSYRRPPPGRLYALIVTALAALATNLVLIGLAIGGASGREAMEDSDGPAQLARLQSAQAALRAAERRADDANRDLELAQGRLRDFLSLYFDELIRSLAQAQAGTPTPRLSVEGPALGQPLLDERASLGSGTARPAAAGQPGTNPQWTALRDRLQQLQRRRTEMLQRLTVEHPAVRDIDLEIAAAVEQLEATPAEIELTPLDNSSPSSPPTSVRPSEQPPLGAGDDGVWVSRSDVAGWQESAKQYGSLAAAVATADARWREALREVDQRRQAVFDAHLDAVERQLADRSPPASIGQAKGAIALAVVAALVLGLVVAGALPRRQTPLDTLDTIEAVERSLGVPVLATVTVDSDGEAGALPQAAKGAWPVRLVRAAELVLAAWVVLGLLVGISHWVGGVTPLEQSRQPVGEGLRRPSMGS